MTCKSSFVYSKNLLNYHFYADHPFNQIRVRLTKELLKSMNQLHEHSIMNPRMATDEELALFHDRTYIEAVKLASKGELPSSKQADFGLNTDDTPVFEGMHDAAALIVGGTLEAIDAVLQNKVSHALNLSGGLHHGFKRKASGFCVYNDAAVGIQYIREKYNMNVLYIDTDAHHGDGVQWAFYEDPHVCTLSIHETGRYLFPGTGYVNERGITKGYGYSFNIPLDAFTQDESFISIYENAFREIIDFFKPDVLITQNGADAHFLDPLTHLNSSMKIYEQIPLLAHQLAHEYCEGRWIALGGGGYDLWRVVPRAWAQIWKVMNDNQPFTGKLPNDWLLKWQKEAPVTLPTYWHDLEEDIPVIPRKEEIMEKNNQMLEHALSYIKTQRNLK
ncbi:acetoin utilization protein AcuC [Cerasibacillus terrae]|uniref:Acetoin utilization protein AcuC n=1 Tax=Cerasibacillus terrae TaxID=2498845 RepID=A0A5C8NHE2_9BACI|nr:acetoin utilization protein AcuC [Cerasibacillus terrae]TXL60552.1 acetoin utilization protein AcuC [Cerasibacillus terrae]